MTAKLVSRELRVYIHLGTVPSNTSEVTNLQLVSEKRLINRCHPH